MLPEEVANEIAIVAARALRRLDGCVSYTDLCVPGFGPIILRRPTASHAARLTAAFAGEFIDPGERRLTGCIRSDHGKYLVESKLQKKVWLSGPEDFGPHAGHTVILYGTFLNGSGPPKAGRSDQRKPGQQSPSRPESNFQVTKIEMLSDTCALNKAKASDQP